MHFTLLILCCTLQVALELLRWNRSETHFLLVGRVFYSPLNNFRSVREPVHCVVATVGLMVRTQYCTAAKLQLLGHIASTK